MPTYGYRCPRCGHEYDKLQKISDVTRVKCPKCGARGERLISGGAGLVFKGSGFYITDYKKQPSGEASKEGGAGKEPGGAEKESGSKKDEPKKPKGDDS
jgi:putative FmdB family regulatory protein